MTTSKYRLHLRAAGPLLMVVFPGCGDFSEPITESESSEAVTASTNYRLIRQSSEKCVDVAGAGTADGTNIQQANCNGGGAQVFRLELLLNGNYRLVNPQSKKCIDVDHSGRANGTNIHLWTCNNTGAQVFAIQRHNDGYLSLRNPNSNKCLDVAWSSPNDGANIHLWDCNGTSAQKFKFVTSSGSNGTVGGTPSTGGGTPSTGGGTPSTGGGTPSTGGNGDPYAAARARCVDRTNALRATKGLRPIARYAPAEACVDGQAKADSESGKAHGSFSACVNQVPNWRGTAQNECPGYPSLESTLTLCIDQMWAEGPGGGHYENMVSGSTKMACGFYTRPDGKVWMVQDFWTD